jgi:hypothetical protein
MPNLKVVSYRENFVGIRLSSKKIAGHVAQIDGTNVINIVLLRECFPLIETADDWVTQLTNMFSLVSRPTVRMENHLVVITMPVYQLTGDWVIEALNELMQQEPIA